MTSFIIGTLIFLVIIVAIVVMVVQRGLQLRHLVDRGVETQGNVEKIWSQGSGSGGSSHRLRYRFRLSDGREFTRAITISPGERDTYREGDEVTVVYLPDKPRVNALLPMVEQAREALKKG